MSQNTPQSVASLLAENERLRKALEPFAKAGRGYRHRIPATRLLSTATGDVCVHDLVRAADAMDGEDSY